MVRGSAWPRMDTRQMSGQRPHWPRCPGLEMAPWQLWCRRLMEFQILESKCAGSGLDLVNLSRLIICRISWCLGRMRTNKRHTDTYGHIRTHADRHGSWVMDAKQTTAFSLVDNGQPNNYSSADMRCAWLRPFCLRFCPPLGGFFFFSHIQHMPNRDDRALGLQE